MEAMAYVSYHFPVTVDITYIKMFKLNLFFKDAWKYLLFK
jgi:hypothetical protein